MNNLEIINVVEDTIAKDFLLEVFGIEYALITQESELSDFALSILSIEEIDLYSNLSELTKAARTKTLNYINELYKLNITNIHMKLTDVVELIKTNVYN